MSEIEARHQRQETLSAELNAGLQDRIDELVEKVNKLSTPELRIDEVHSDHEEVPMEVLQTPKGKATAKAGETSKPHSAISNVADEAKERLNQLLRGPPFR